MDTSNLLQLRFNTENTGSLFWRVIVDSQEHLADDVKIEVPSFTTQDVLPDGRIKFHLSCRFNELIWEGTNLIVR